MKTHVYKAGMLCLCLTSIFLRGIGQAAIPVTVEADHALFEIQPTMWGLFFEDINFAADGGIYAELVKNRSFEFPDPMDGWTVEGASFFNSPVQIVNRKSLHVSNPRMARIQVEDSVCMINNGFRGMGIHADRDYVFSLLSSLGSGSVSIRIQLIGADGSEIASGQIEPDGSEWRKYEFRLAATETDARASLRLCFKGKGTINFDMVSLFPAETWNNRSNGLRADLVQKLADLKPGFLRFPGGCIVEGRDLEKRYRWKNTIGKIEERGIIINRWNDENSRATPDYFQSFGLGFYEYFLLAEDLGAEPVPILNCGMACQFNTGEVVAMEEMGTYIQDALDLIEFANGPAESEWGRIRTEMGHPEPFHMKYLGIGNEQWGPLYFERYALFEKVLQEQHPEIMLISSTGPLAAGPLFDFGQSELRKFSPALVDEHYYNRPEWFFNNASRYDPYDRNTYKIFAGEFAAHNVRMASPENKNIWEAALAEAAFMTGLERNADVVYMASYAPLLAHTDAWQWTPDLIWFDNLTSYGTPSYYVQKLFSTNRGTDLLQIHRKGEALTGENGIYASCVLDKDTEEIIIKIVSNNITSVPVEFRINSRRKTAPAALKTVLQHPDLSAMNTLSDPECLLPEEEYIEFKRNKCTLQLDPYSVTVLKLKLQ